MPRRKSLKSQFNESEEKTADSTVYFTTNSENDIILHISPGDTGQIALTEIRLDDIVILSNHIGRLSNFTPGKNKFLQNKVLDIYTAITDIPGLPDRTSFWIQVSGGEAIYENSMQKTVSMQGATILYFMKIIFK